MSKTTERKAADKAAEDFQSEVYRDALDEISRIRDAISIHFSGPGQPQRREDVKASVFVRKLLHTYDDQQRMQREAKQHATRVCKQADELKAAIKFISDVCSQRHGSVALGCSDRIVLDMASILKELATRVESLVTAHRGLLQGMQPHNEKNFLDECLILDSSR